jgi:hypothetical protein
VSRTHLTEQPQGRRRIVFYLIGIVAFPGLAAVTGLLAAVFAYGGSVGIGLVVWVVTTAVPIVLLIVRGGRLRVLAYGMATSAGALVVAVVGWPVLFPGESADSQLADIAAHSSTPVYYPGPNFQGHSLDDVVIFSQNSDSGSPNDRSFDTGDRLDLGYGSTCSFLTTDCGDLIDIEMYRGTLPYPPDFCAERVAGPRGTVLVRDSGTVWIAFTGDLALRVEETDKQFMVNLVTALRTSRDSSETTSVLPPPSAATLHQIEDACG